jgi:hypothetical protein
MSILNDEDRARKEFAQPFAVVEIDREVLIRLTREELKALGCYQSSAALERFRIGPR